MKNLLFVITTAFFLSAVALFADSMSSLPPIEPVPATQPATTEPATQPTMDVERDDQSIASLHQTISSLETELDSLKEENARLRRGHTVFQTTPAATQPASTSPADETEATRLRKRVALLQSEIRRLKSDNTALRASKPDVSSSSDSSSASSSHSSSGHSSSASSHDGSVHVKGYHRKDGTYVRPHTRRRR